MPGRARFILPLFLALSSRAGIPPVLPPPETLMRLLRTNLVMEPVELDREASAALVARFGGRLLGPDESEPAPDSAPALADKSRFDGGVLYVRIGQVGPALAPQLQAALEDSAWNTNAVGLVVDLRFAGGEGFESAGKTAALFADHPGDLLDWGAGSVRSDGRTPAWKKPVTVLVNGSTSGPAEALAAVLRLETGAVLIGQSTAGQAAVHRDLPLEGGGRLRLPVASVRLGNGELVPPRGLQPDITVRLTPQQERAYLADPFTAVVAGPASDSGTNRVASTVTVRRRINEAELVRAQRDGTVPGDAKGGSGASAQRVVQDPVLARSLDLIRGLAILRKR